ncbi:MAG: helix-turn-helix transcriptional regulator [Clostridia bacterium]|nr:helix-turn-helix transcriptional regulator [Clostridia bacterium]
MCHLHFHDEIEIIAVAKGIKRVYVNEKEYVLSEGDVVFVNSRIPHGTQDDPPMSDTVLLQFRADAFLELPHENRPLRHLARFLSNASECPIRVIRRADDDGAFFEYVWQLSKEREENAPFYNIRLRGYVYLILGYLYREGILQNVETGIHNRSIEKVLPALSYIDEHYAEDIPLSALSSLCGLSEGYFCRQFKAATGNTFIEYLNFVRIYNAEKLLNRSEKPILDISMEVGFSTVSYFNRTFRRFKSCSPGNYRRAQYLRE